MKKYLYLTSVVLLSSSLSSNEDISKTQVYEEPNPTSKKVGEINIKYVEKDKIQDIKHNNYSKYPWYLYPLGWFTHPYLQEDKTIVLKNKKEEKTETANKIKEVKLIQEVKEKQIEEIQKKLEEKKAFFLDLGVGYAYSPYDKKDITGSISTNPIEENGIFYDLGVGYRFNENVFSTINYQHLALDDLNYDEFYATLNYQLVNEFNPFVGILVGQSKLRWDKDLLNNSQTKDMSSTSLIYGLQAGLEYDISTNLSFVPKFSYKIVDHGTDLVSAPAKSKIEHNSKLQVSIGFRIDF